MTGDLMVKQKQFSTAKLKVEQLVMEASVAKKKSTGPRWWWRKTRFFGKKGTSAFEVFQKDMQRPPQRIPRGRVSLGFKDHETPLFQDVFGIPAGHPNYIRFGI